MIKYQIELIDNEESFNSWRPVMNRATALAVDIETINWWSRADERISIVQIAFREEERLKVLIFDLLRGWNPEFLRESLEMGLQPKAIHNASFDAVKIALHYGIRTSPVHDTMLAARRNGERPCTLKSQVEKHLGFELEKTSQRSDWSRRPLSRQQLQYAALDAASTLLLYELQVQRGLRGDYELKGGQRPSPAPFRSSPSVRASNMTSSANSGLAGPPALGTGQKTAPPADLTAAIVEIVATFPGRYSSRQLAASISAERTGMIGWTLDRIIGPDSQIDESTASSAITLLIDQEVFGVDINNRLIPVFKQ